jgi:superfamily II DNA or RNA helicase
MLIDADHKARIDLNYPPDWVVEYIKEALTIPNMEKKEAARHHIWGWQNMPDSIELWEEKDGELIVPRGFLMELERGLKKLGMEPSTDFYGVKFPEADYGEPLKEPRRWQAEAIPAIEKNFDGIYQAPAGSGKTVTILLAIAKLGLKSIIIVNTKDILWQWQERVVDFLGPDIEIGQIGDDDFYVSPQITIATAQTLHRRFESLESEGFFDDFGFMCLDECHHATADTYRHIVNRFSAGYRIGVSATPEKTGDFRLAERVLGPIFHVTEPEEVDTLVKPKIVCITTDFKFPFKATMSRYQRSNYPDLLKALIEDPKRNELIVDRIMQNKGTHQLVISKRLDHLDRLFDMVEAAGYPDEMIKLTGKESPEERQYAKATLETRPSIVFSTLADEALDVPRLDRIHLTYPQRNTGLITQQIGRVERSHEGKESAIVYDYADRKCGVLESQYRERLFQVYKKRALEIDNS